jgi:hypothetical protein
MDDIRIETKERTEKERNEWVKKGILRLMFDEFDI